MCLRWETNIKNGVSCVKLRENVYQHMVWISVACDICYANKYLRNIFLLTFCLRHSGTSETKLSETQTCSCLCSSNIFLLGYNYICTWYLFGTETSTRTMEIQMWRMSWMWICVYIYISYKTTGRLSISSHATNKNSFYYSAWPTLCHMMNIHRTFDILPHTVCRYAVWSLTGKTSTWTSW